MEKKFSYLDNIPGGHFCILSSTVNIFENPDLQECPCCHLTLADEVAQCIGQPCSGAACPDCGEKMAKWSEMNPNFCKRFGEVHAYLCYDERNHYQERLRAGTLSLEDYVASRLAEPDDRELMGASEKSKSHHIYFQLSDADLLVRERDPALFQQLVERYIRARAELSYQHEVQRGNKSRSERFEQFTSNFKRDGHESLPTPRAR